MIEGLDLIPLHSRDGEVRAYALVDAADADWLNEWPWHLNDKGYAKRGNERPIYMHRELLGLATGDDREGDHLNRNRLDNRRCNLRAVAKGANRQNRSSNERETSSRFRGVSWQKRAGKWRAYVRVDGRLRFLGEYDDEVEAARVAAAARHEALPFAVELA